jgi:hypothetical protein
MKSMKKALRRQKTQNYIQKQKKIVSINSHHSFNRSGGYFKKQAAMDCGNPKCGLCGNPRKSKAFKGRDNSTLQEKKSQLSLHEY